MEEQKEENEKLDEKSTTDEVNYIANDKSTIDNQTSPNSHTSYSDESESNIINSVVVSQPLTKDDLSEKISVSELVAEPSKLPMSLPDKPIVSPLLPRKKQEVRNEIERTMANIASQTQAESQVLPSVHTTLPNSNIAATKTIPTQSSALATVPSKANVNQDLGQCIPTSISVTSTSYSTTVTPVISEAQKLRIPIPEVTNQIGSNTGMNRLQSILAGSDSHHNVIRHPLLNFDAQRNISQRNIGLNPPVSKVESLTSYKPSQRFSTPEVSTTVNKSVIQVSQSLTGVNVNSRMANVPAVQRPSISLIPKTVMEHDSDSEDSRVPSMAKLSAEVKAEESDMDDASDSDNRLVVDSDSRTDDAHPGDVPSDDEMGVTSPRSLNNVRSPSESSQSLSLLSVLPTVVHQGNIARQNTMSGIGYPFNYTSSQIKAQLSTKTSHETNMSQRSSIPVVVSELSAPVFEAMQQSHINRLELKSLPVDLGKIRREIALPTFSDDSLLKTNRPMTRPTIMQTLTDVQMKTSIVESFGRSVSQPIVATKGKKMKMKPLTTLKSEDQDIQKKSMQKSQMDVFLSEREMSEGKEKYGIYGGGSMDSEGRVKKEKPSGSIDGDDVYKDTASCEEQVRSIISKYSLHESPERREVSVKDMRRVIPQLIMCLFSKEDHHARKVKGLWERKPDNWPDEIPYCDPNNSNRTSDGTGKPKKETLHKMFNFLLDKYLQKGPNEILFTMPPSTPETPQPSGQVKLKPKHKERPSFPSITSQPLTPKNVTEMSSNVTITNNSCLLLATGNLSSLFNQVHGGNLSSTNNSDDPFHKSLHQSLSLGKTSPGSTMEDPPMKKQKLFEGRQHQATFASHLPTVVNIHSPVQENTNQDAKHMQEMLRVSEAARLSTTSTMTNQLFMTPNYTSAGYFTQQNQAILKQAVMEERSHSPRYISLPSIDVMPNLHRQLPPQGGMPGSSIFMTMPNTSGGQVHTPTLTIPICHSMGSPLSYMPSQPQSHTSQAYITTQALTGVPILGGDAIEKLTMEGSVIHGVVPQMFQHSPQSHNLAYSNNLAQIQSMAQNTHAQNISDVHSPHIAKPLRIETPKIVPGTGGCDRRLFHSLPATAVINTNQPAPLLTVTTQPFRKRHLTSPEYTTDSRLHNQNEDLQAANAILMLANTQMSPKENIKPSTPVPVEPKEEPKDEHQTELKHEYPSIDSSYHSMQNSFSIGSPSGSYAQIPTNSSLPQISYLQSPGNVNQMNIVQFLQNRQRLQNMQNMTLPISSAIQTIPLSSSHRMTTSDTQTLSSRKPELLLQSGSSPKEVIYPAIDKAVSLHRSSSPGSDTSSAEVSSTRQSPTDYNDHPLSLVLHNNHENSTPLQESVTAEVNKEESCNPIQETMSRVQDKMMRVETLHRIHRFHEKDLSLLMLVLDLLKQKQSNLRQRDLVDFMLSCHKLEATFDVALLEKHVPDSLREDWRDYIEKNYFEVVARARPRNNPPTDAPVFRLSTRP